MSGTAALEHIKQLDKPMLTAQDIAPVVGCNPNVLRLMARKDPGQLGFPSTCFGKQVRFPKWAFIKHMEG